MFYLNKYFIPLILLISIIGLINTQKKTSDENRPYKFGFNIDGQQHRHEEKDENGLISGEFGFITADGVYHVTVYATDEQGRFKIVSMKSIKVSPPLDGSPDYSKTPIQTSVNALQNPPTPTIDNVETTPQTSQISNVIPNQEFPIQQAIVPASGPSVTLQKPLGSCSSCSIPTTTKVPPIFSVQPQYPTNNQENTPVNQYYPQNQQPNSNYPQNQATRPNYPQNPYNPPNPIQNTNYPSNPTEDINYPQNPSYPQTVNYPTQQYPNQPLQPIPNPPSQELIAPFKPNEISSNSDTDEPISPDINISTFPPGEEINTNYDLQPVNPDIVSTPDIPNTPSQELISPFLPNEIPQNYEPNVSLSPELNISPLPQGGVTDNNFQPVNPITSTIDYNIPQISSTNRPPPASNIPDGLFFPGLIHPPNNPPAGENPTTIGQMPPGVTTEDMRELMYKFNYTVGFHGHYEVGYRSGIKVGAYYVNGRDGYSRIVEYTADEYGFHPQVHYVFLGLDSPDIPKENTEKDYGLKGYIFEWYSIG